MESANRDAAIKCLKRAKLALSRGDTKEAERLVRKSLRLCTSQEAEGLLKVVLSGGRGGGGDQTTSNNNTQSEQQSDTGKSGGVNNGRSQTSTGDENVRQRQTSPQTEYTKDQQEAVQRVLGCNNFYDILGVAQDADEAELKKQYRNLALSVHPDKNSAPKADEAFKAVGKAYSVLSDSVRRNQYDRFGEDGLQSQGVAPEQEFSPDDVFRMFFGDNFTFGADDRYMYRTDDGGLFMFGDGRSHRRFRHHQHHHRRESGGLLHLCQLLPLLFIVLVSLSSSLLQSFLSEPPPYSLYKTSQYQVKRTVEKYDIPYYVMANFKSTHRNQIRNVESMVVGDFMSYLSRTCKEEKFYGQYDGTSCKKLQKLRKRINSNNL